jgi:hypothetical protein
MGLEQAEEWLVEEKIESRIRKEVEVFLRNYEKATNTHDFSNVKPLLAKDLTYWFSDGNYNTVEELEKKFTKTWDIIKNEEYSISDVKWISLDVNSAVCIYTFKWKGLISGKVQSGEGRGTNVMVKRDSNWFMIHEHLSKI